MSQHMHRPLGWGGASSGVTVLCRLRFPEGSLRVQNKQCLIRQLLIQGPPPAQPPKAGWRPGAASWSWGLCSSAPTPRRSHAWDEHPQGLVRFIVTETRTYGLTTSHPSNPVMQPVWGQTWLLGRLGHVGHGKI